MPAGATYEPIATSTVSGSSITSYTFSSISSSYTDLILICSLQSTRATDGSVSVRIRLNGDTATNYSSTQIYGNGTSALSGISSTADAIYQIGEAPGGPTLTNVFGLTKINLFSYTGSTNKSVLSEWAADRNGAGITGRTVGLWRNTAAITSITVYCSTNNIAVGSTLSLYGIKAA